MNFHPDDFIALSVAVEAEGGRCLSEVCQGEVIKLKVPDARGHMIWKRFHTTHCDMSAKMEIPYDPRLRIRIEEEDPSQDEPITIVNHPGEEADRTHARVCAVDDCVGLWPRYAKVVSKRSYQSPLGGSI